ncbi:MAG: tetratricopeptide repeat protein [Firmicutes bacterium]|nr:tetratricopeptide repeat protein [Bacillota bacterium]
MQIINDYKQTNDRSKHPIFWLRNKKEGIFMKGRICYLLAFILSIVLIAVAAHAIAESAIGTVTVTSDGNVNIRSEGNTDARVVGQAKPGEVYTCTGTAVSGWYEILLYGGTIGYISPKMVEFAELEFDIEEINARIESDPNDALAWQDKGDYYQARREYEEAYEAFSRAIELDGSAYQYGSRAAVLTSMQDYKKAYDDRTCVIELEETAEHYARRGNLLRQMKEYEAAVKDCEMALAIDGTYSYGYFILGRISYEIKKYDEALEYYMTAQKHGYDEGVLYNQIGLVYEVRDKNWKEAIKWYTEAIKRIKGPNSNDTSIRYSNRGNCYYRIKSYENAIKDLKKAIEINRENARAYGILGCLYYEQRNYKKALENMEKAVQYAPDNSNWKDWLKTIKAKVK